MYVLLRSFTFPNLVFQQFERNEFHGNDPLVNRHAYHAEFFVHKHCFVFLGFPYSRVLPERDISDNRLMGSIPSQVGLLSRLKYLCASL
jgi:hypothetical protein